MISRHKPETISMEVSHTAGNRFPIFRRIYRLLIGVGIILPPPRWPPLDGGAILVQLRLPIWLPTWRTPGGEAYFPGVHTQAHRRANFLASLAGVWEGRCGSFRPPLQKFVGGLGRTKLGPRAKQIGPPADFFWPVCRLWGHTILGKRCTFCNGIYQQSWLAGQNFWGPLQKFLGAVAKISRGPCKSLWGRWQKFVGAAAKVPAGPWQSARRGMWGAAECGAPPSWAQPPSDIGRARGKPAVRPEFRKPNCTRTAPPTRGAQAKTVPHMTCVGPFWVSMVGIDAA